MSVTVGSVSIAAYITATESGPASALSAGVQSDAWTISANGIKSPTAVTMRIGTGTAISANVIASVMLHLAGASQELDLSALVTLLGTKSLAKVRGLIGLNNADAESGHTVIVEGGASNPFIPFLTGTSPGLVVPAQGVALLTNPNIAAWLVDGSHKTLKFDPGANTVDFYFGIVGE